MLVSRRGFFGVNVIAALVCCVLVCIFVFLLLTKVHLSVTSKSLFASIGGDYGSVKVEGCGIAAVWEVADYLPSLALVGWGEMREGSKRECKSERKCHIYVIWL